MQVSEFKTRLSQSPELQELIDRIYNKNFNDQKISEYVKILPECQTIGNIIKDVYTKFLKDLNNREDLNFESYEYKTFKSVYNSFFLPGIIRGIKNKKQIIYL